MSTKASAWPRSSRSCAPLCTSSPDAWSTANSTETAVSHCFSHILGLLFSMLTWSTVMTSVSVPVLNEAIKRGEQTGHKCMRSHARLPACLLPTGINHEITDTTHR